MVRPIDSHTIKTRASELARDLGFTGDCDSQVERIMWALKNEHRQSTDEKYDEANGGDVASEGALVRARAVCNSAYHRNPNAAREYCALCDTIAKAIDQAVVDSQ